jgi:hypothetical protein
MLTGMAEKEYTATEALHHDLLHNIQHEPAANFEALLSTKRERRTNHTAYQA